MQYILNFPFNPISTFSVGCGFGCFAPLLTAALLDFVLCCMYFLLIWKKSISEDSNLIIFVRATPFLKGF